MGATFGSDSWEPIDVTPPADGGHGIIRGIPNNRTGSCTSMRNQGIIADFSDLILLRRRRRGADIYDDEKAGESGSEGGPSSGPTEDSGEVNQRYSDGQTPLTFAIRQKDLVMVRQILAYPGVDVNYPEEKQFSLNSRVLAPPLVVATKARRPELVQALLDAGADVNARDSFSCSALLYAAEQGDEESVRVLLRRKPHLSFQEDNYTPLHKACRNGYLGVVKLLLAAGSDINAEMNDVLITPLKLALVNKHEDVVSFLLQNGATFEKTSDDLRPGLSTVPAFVNACMMCSSQIVQYLIESGADVNMTAEDGTAALFHAVRSGQLAHIAREGKVCAPSHLIKIHNKLRGVFLESVSVINKLCEAGVWLDKTDRWGSTAIYRSLKERNIPACVILLKHGARWDDLCDVICRDSSIIKLNEIDRDLYLHLYHILGSRRLYLIENKHDGSSPNIRQVPSLKQTCRQMIRESVTGQQSTYKTSIIPRLQTLPLPRALIEYVCFSEIEPGQLVSSLSESYLNHMLISLLR